jgi:hypothetical protein
MVLLEFESTVATVRKRPDIFVYTMGGRGITIHEHTAQVDEALYFIFPTRPQKVLEPLYYGVCTA